MYSFQFTRAGSPQHFADWRLLRERNYPLAAAHAPHAVPAVGNMQDLWCRVLDDRETLVSGAVIAVARSRKLPIVRVGRMHFATPFLQRLGPRGVPRFIEALASYPEGPSSLSMHVYALDESDRVEAEGILKNAGFEREPQARSFHHTLLVSVEGSREERLTRLSYAARRGIRQVAGRGFRVQPIIDTALSPRVAWLNTEAHRRTGGNARAVDFSMAITAAREDPDNSIVLGVFHPERPEPVALVGFAHGLVSGSSVVYASAGTERAEDIGATPLSYGLVDALLEWTAARGFAYFDFGGITPENTPEHPLARISEFKRKFRGRDAQVAADYRVAVRPFSAAVLRALELPARLLGPT